MNRAPNIILIVADDMGYGDASCYGSGAIHTVLIIYADQHGHDCLGAYGNFVA